MFYRDRSLSCKLFYREYIDLVIDRGHAFTASITIHRMTGERTTGKISDAFVERKQNGYLNQLHKYLKNS